jgi:hypothetical protein
MSEKSIIDFWGIGAQKAGTSWLFYYLSRIPEFDIPPYKELHYFDRDPKYPSPNRLSKTKLVHRLFEARYLRKAYWAISSAIKRGDRKELNFYLKWYFSNLSDEWYLSLFRPYTGITGEITPSYSMLNREDIKRMYNLSPSAKLILMVRNPVDRAWSHFRHTKKGQKDFRIEQTTVDQIIEFLESDDQLQRSDYLQTLDNYSAVFPRDQILIGFYDAIIENPGKLLKEITQFLGVEEIEEIKSSKVVHKSIELDCPVEVKAYLQEKYHDQIREMAERFGGYFSKWYNDTYEEKFQNGDQITPVQKLV